jgi:hypothetical protein
MKKSINEVFEENNSKYIILDLEIPNFTYNKRIYVVLNNENEMGFDFSSKDVAVFKDDNIKTFKNADDIEKKEYLVLFNMFKTLIEKNKYTTEAVNVFKELQNLLEN